MDELDLSMLRYGGANVTGFRLVDREEVRRTTDVQRLLTRLGGAAYRQHLAADNMLKVRRVCSTMVKSWKGHNWGEYQFPSLSSISLSCQ